MRRPLLHAAAVVALVSIVAGCGGADGNDEGAPPAETAGETAPVETAEAASPSATVASGWTVTGIGRGIKPALALDREGQPAIAWIFENLPSGFVKYASSTDGWAEQTIDEGYFYGPLDLAFDAEGRANVVWHDHEGEEFDPRRGNLAHAVFEGGRWDVSAVRDRGHDGWDSTIAIGTDGVVRAAGVDPSQFGSEDGVEYYERGSDGGWRVESIGSGPIAYEFNVSLAVTPGGRPALSFYDDRAGDLVFGTREGGSWTLETVAAEGDVGKYSSLAVDADGRPHISFFDQTSESSGTIRYAVKDGGAWEVEEVGALDQVATGMAGARRNSALALDPDGVPHVAFTHKGVLRYATRTPTGWQLEDVVTAAGAPLGQLVSLRIDDRGGEHIASYEVTGEAPLDGLVFYLTRG